MTDRSKNVKSSDGPRRSRVSTDVAAKVWGAANLLGCRKGIATQLFVASVVLGCWGFPCWHVAASAGEARVVEASGHTRIIVDTSDASALEVLGALGAHFEFTIEPGARPGQPIRYTGRLEGSLEDLLARVLRHQGHMIVRSAEAPAGISSVVLIEAKEGSPAPTVANAITALKAKLQGKELPKDGEEAGR